MRCNNKLKFPKNPATLTKKIRQDNPWLVGESLAKTIEDNWQDVSACKTCDDLSKVTCMVEWGRVHYLAVYHLANTLMKTYLK